MSGKEEITITLTFEEIMKIKEAIDIIRNKIESILPSQCSWNNPRKRP